MDIPLVSALPLGSISSLGPLANRAPVAEVAPALVPLAPSLTTVDLSPLGQFLSASSLFQKKLLELQVSATTVSEAQAREFSELLASSSTLAVAFNALETTDIGGTDVDAGSLEQQSLASLFAQQFEARTEAAGGDAQTALASLASIGLFFTPSPVSAASLQVDLPLLQVALEVDPATTTALLGRAAESFGALVPANVGVAALIAEPAQGEPLVPAGVEVPTLLAQPPAQAAPERVDTSERQDLANAGNVVAAQLDDKALAANQAGAAAASRAAAEQSLAERAAMLAENEGRQEDRFAMSERVEEQNRLKQASIDVQARIDEEQRQQALRSAQQLVAGSTPPLETTAIGAPFTPPAAQALEQEMPLPAPTPQPGLREQALQAARDPAIAAAIAAYSLNTGAFGALNARQELAAQRPKVVPAVSAVDKVTAVTSATEPKAGTR